MDEPRTIRKERVRGENGCRSWHWQSVYSRRQRKAHCCSVAREPRPPYDAATLLHTLASLPPPPLPLLPCLPNTQSPPPCRCPLHASLIVIPLAVLPCLPLLPCSPGLTYCTSALMVPPLSLSLSYTIYFCLGKCHPFFVFVSLHAVYLTASFPVDAFQSLFQCNVFSSISYPLI